MFLELGLLALLVGSCAGYYRSRRGRLEAEAEALRLQARLPGGEPDEWLFDGALAEVLDAEPTHGGSDQTGPWLAVRSRCRMPSGAVFEVRVKTATRQGAAQVTVRPLLD